MGQFANVLLYVLQIATWKEKKEKIVLLSQSALKNILQYLMKNELIIFGDIL